MLRIRRARLAFLALVGLAIGTLSACTAVPPVLPTSGTICVTPVTSCPMAVSLPIGASCFCSGAPGAGTVF